MGESLAVLIVEHQCVGVITQKINTSFALSNVYRTENWLD